MTVTTVAHVKFRMRSIKSNQWVRIELAVPESILIRSLKVFFLGLQSKQTKKWTYYAMGEYIISHTTWPMGTYRWCQNPNIESTLPRQSRVSF